MSRDLHETGNESNRETAMVPCGHQQKVSIPSKIAFFCGVRVLKTANAGCNEHNDDPNQGQPQNRTMPCQIDTFCQQV
jgi:hypothetical protein